MAVLFLHMVDAGHVQTDFSATSTGEADVVITGVVEAAWARSEEEGLMTIENMVYDSEASFSSLLGSEVALWGLNGLDIDLDYNMKRKYQRINQTLYTRSSNLRQFHICNPRNDVVRSISEQLHSGAPLSRRASKEEMFRK